MKINLINIENLRVFNNINLVPGSNFNFILGPNGSGKTSLLESIYLLARAKSFRTKKNKVLISEGENSLIISATIENQNSLITKLNLIKTPGSTIVTAAGTKQTKLSEIARIIPLGIITPNTQNLILDGPKYRRKFLDWGVFHVEHDYTEVFRTYQKILNQRNYLLKNKDKDFKVWDKQLIKFGERLDLIRTSYFYDWCSILKKYLKTNHVFHKLKIEYKNGWSETTKLQKILEQRFALDIKNGFTSVGPHRADILIRIGDIQAKEILSRGQIKLLTILMIISQLNLLNNKCGESPILLIDDLDAELDKEKQNLIIEIIKNNSFQAFITMTDVKKNQYMSLNTTKVFHVEHGKIL